MPILSCVSISQTTIPTPRGTFAARTAGLASAPLVLCLHGFPDDASTFDHLLPQLATMGCYAVAPYLRGYAPSPLMPPLGIGSLAEDLCAIAGKLARGQQINVIGHDLGGQVFYRAAAMTPQHFHRAVTLAAPHALAIVANAKWSPRAWWRGRYIAKLQKNPSGERMVAADDYAYIETLWRRWSPGYVPPAEHIERVKQTFRRSMPAPVTMYRSDDWANKTDPIAIPTLCLLGENDACTAPPMAAGQANYFSNDYRLDVLPNVGHFLHHEQPAEVLKRIEQWLTQR